ncbi:hypothetical protein SAMN04488581_2619 [Mycolicibacterium neoaurum]|uniref:hypothetical protein n=1 Tax=Mycolicibacterium neoaurum TaxID=1795 RepID=UPI00055D2B77|nr:hypothetical protein [Mycolicibacterium neoaurum]SDD59389.1 hypothetical protein SAMN04488581_2619 [Mycolicibacterium neoaurum]
MTPTPAKYGSRERLETRIIRMSQLLKRARNDGDQLFIDMAERDLNQLLDQLPREAAPGA